MEIASRNRWLYIAGSILIVALAAVIRIRGAQNDLWLDEIWSLHLASLISGPLGIFTQIHQDSFVAILVDEHRTSQPWKRLH
jgi:hypothetical protein